MTSNEEYRSNPSSPADQTTSGGNLTTERTKEEQPVKEEEDEGKCKELSVEASPEKMEVEPKDTPSNEKQSMCDCLLIPKCYLKEDCILTPELLFFSQALRRKRHP